MDYKKLLDGSKKIGIACKNMSHGQLSYQILNTVDALMKDGYDPFIFCEDVDLHICKIPCGVFNMYDMNNFFGTIITTNSNTTEFALNATGDNRIIYYVWELEWLQKPVSVDIFYKVEKVYTRSESYAKKIYSFSNIKPEIKKKFDVSIIH